MYFQKIKRSIYTVNTKQACKNLPNSMLTLKLHNRQNSLIHLQTLNLSPSIMNPYFLEK